MKTMNYLIRRMNISDIEQIYRIECRVFPNPWPKAFFESDLQKPNTIALVAEDQGIIIGYGLANNIDFELHITNIAVDVPYQNQGIGKRLLIEIERIGKNKGSIIAYLEVRVSNKIAIKLYKDFGYRILQIRKGYYLDGTDAYVMIKELKNDYEI